MTYKNLFVKFQNGLIRYLIGIGNSANLAEFINCSVHIKRKCFDINLHIQTKKYIIIYLFFRFTFT